MAGVMSPIATSVCDLIEAMWYKTFLEQFVGKDTCLWQSMYSFLDFDIYVALFLVLLYIILGNYVFRRDPPIFIPISGVPR